jgi:hypothetical protein
VSLILLDGCEDISSWSTSGGSIVTGRYNNCFRFTTSATYNRTLLSVEESDTLTVGFALRMTGTPNTAATFLGLRSDAGATSHLELQSDVNGRLAVMRPFTTIITTATGIVIPGTWHYVEMQARLHDTTGAVTLRVDGATVGTFSGDTKNAGTKTVFDQVRLVFPFNNVTSYDFDDFYIMSGAGDSFLGSVTVETLYPNGDGDSNQWLGSDGNSTDNWDLVNEVGSPVTTDYTSTATVGQQDLYALGPLVHTDGTIVAIDHSAYMLRTDAVTPINVKLLNRRGATTVGPALPLGTSYRSYDYCLTVDPETGLPFTIADVNALQSGVAFADPPSPTWYRNARSSVRVAFQGATTSVKLGGAQARVLSEPSGGKALVGYLNVRVLSSPTGGQALVGYLNTRVLSEPQTGGRARLGAAALRVLQPPVPVSARFWDGTAYVVGAMRVWNGAAWVYALGVRVWNGTAWVDAIV